MEDEDEDEDEDEHRDTNFDVQIATSVQQRNHIAQQLTKKKSRLEELEDDLPLYVLQHTEQQDVDAEFRQMATETYQLRVDVHGLVSLPCKTQCSLKILGIMLQFLSLDLQLLRVHDFSMQNYCVYLFFTGNRNESC